jgi:hypothetical protein
MLGRLRVNFLSQKEKLLSLTTVAALVSCLCATSIFGRNDPSVKEPAEKPSAVVTSETKGSEKLRNDVAKMVNEAKAGKVKMPAQQFPQTQRNNLSKGATIGIIAGIAGAIILIAILVKLNSD